MAQLGQTTNTGSRAQAFYEDQAVIVQLTPPVNCTLNFIGIFCYESASANENDLKAFVYNAGSGSLLFTSNILANAISSTSIGAPTNAQVTFTGASLTGGTAYNFVIAATGRGGTPIASGQNGSGLVPTLLQNSNIYGAPPNPISGGTVTNQPRAWDIYIDYTATGGGGSSSNQKFLLLGVG